MKNLLTIISYSLNSTSVVENNSESYIVRDEFTFSRFDF